MREPRKNSEGALVFSSEITEQTQVTWQQRVLVWEQQRPCEDHERDFYM